MSNEFNNNRMSNDNSIREVADENVNLVDSNSFNLSFVNDEGNLQSSEESWVDPGINEDYAMNVTEDISNNVTNYLNEFKKCPRCQ